MHKRAIKKYLLLISDSLLNPPNLQFSELPSLLLNLASDDADKEPTFLISLSALPLLHSSYFSSPFFLFLSPFLHSRSLCGCVRGCCYLWTCPEMICQRELATNWSVDIRADSFPMISSTLVVAAADRTIPACFSRSSPSGQSSGEPRDFWRPPTRFFYINFAPPEVTTFGLAARLQSKFLHFMIYYTLLL